MRHSRRWASPRSLFAALSVAAVFSSALPASAVGLRVSSFLGASDQDRILDAAVGADGSIYLAGVTESADFPGGEAGSSFQIPGFDPRFRPKRPERAEDSTRGRDPCGCHRNLSVLTSLSRS